MKKRYTLTGKKFVKIKSRFVSGVSSEKNISVENDPDYQTCPRCDGWGYKKDNVNIKCKHCLGQGRVDWIEYIVGKRAELTGLEKVNLRLFISRLHYLFDNIDLGQNVDNFLEQNSNFKRQVKAILDDLIRRKGLEDYKIETNFEEKKIDVYLKLASSMDYVIYSIKIN